MSDLPVQTFAEFEGTLKRKETTDTCRIVALEEIRYRWFTHLMKFIYETYLKPFASDFLNSSSVTRQSE